MQRKDTTLPSCDWTPCRRNKYTKIYTTKLCKAKDIFESSQSHQASLQLFAAMDAASDDEPEGKAAGKVYQAWCIDIDIHLYIYTWIESTGYDVLHMLHLNKHSVDFDRSYRCLKHEYCFGYDGIM